MDFQRVSSEFQPTRPLRGATRRYPTHEGAPPHFNPRAPCGARRWTRPHSSSAYDFNPRAPCGARPLWLPSTVLWDIFQPTRPLRGATSGNTVTFTEGEYFNPRAPCGARRRKPDDSCGRYPDFNPRAPCGARLWRASPKARRSRHFNPRAPCGARLFTFVGVSVTVTFQPTRPLRGATFLRLLKPGEFCISTHAPLAGRDGGILGAARAVCAHFNPRAPCGARLSTPPIPHRSYQFQPTRPLRGATCLMLFPCKIELVFQPTRPLRGATAVERPQAAAS